MAYILVAKLADNFPLGEINIYSLRPFWPKTGEGCATLKSSVGNLGVRKFIGIGKETTKVDTK